MTNLLAADTIASIDDVVATDLVDDPYPVYARARRLSPVVHIPAVNLHLISRFDDILAVERDPVTFSSFIPESNVVRLFGSNLMRKDGEAHRRERKAIDPGLRPGTAKRCWGPPLKGIVDNIIDSVAGDGETDLFATVAEPIAGSALAEVIGIPDVDWKTIARWSQAMIDGAGNYVMDPAIDAQALETALEIEAAVDRGLDQPGGPVPDSLLANMQQAGLSRLEIYGNTKVAVGGGFNEPRDALLSLVYGLLLNPEQLRLVMHDEKLWPHAFEEAVRWISPIGIYPRKLTRDAEIGGVMVPEGTQVGLAVASANREEERFAQPDRFDISRPKGQHLAFGSGPHYCAGTWVARMLVGALAAPELFRRLPNLRLLDPSAVSVQGWVFRGPTRLPVKWDC